MMFTLKTQKQSVPANYALKSTKLSSRVTTNLQLEFTYKRAYTSFIQHIAHTHTNTHKHTITAERAMGCLCQPHFTVAYHGQAYPACGQPLLIHWVNTSTSAAWRLAHTPRVPSNMQPQSQLQAVWLIECEQKIWQHYWASVIMSHTQPLCFPSAVFEPSACVHPLSPDSEPLSSQLSFLLTLA